MPASAASRRKRAQSRSGMSGHDPKVEIDGVRETDARLIRKGRFRPVLSFRAVGLVESPWHVAAVQGRPQRAEVDEEETACLDIAGALELDGAGSPANLLEACRLGKIRHHFRHKSRWWMTKPIRPDVLPHIFEPGRRGDGGRNARAGAPGPPRPRLRPPGWPRRCDVRAPLRRSSESA